MSEKSLIGTWNEKAASFVEETRDGTVVVTVGDERCEMSKAEWEQLSSYQDGLPGNFDKPAFQPFVRRRTPINSSPEIREKI